MASPTSRSLVQLRKLNYMAQVVEKFNAFSKTRIDLFGCIDILAVMPASENRPARVLGIQATSTGNMSSRIAKSLAEPKLKIWLQAGCKFEVWGWAKRGGRGDRKLWTLKRQEIVLLGCVPYAKEVK